MSFLIQVDSSPTLQRERAISESLGVQNLGTTSYVGAVLQSVAGSVGFEQVLRTFNVARQFSTRRTGSGKELSNPKEHVLSLLQNMRREGHSASPLKLLEMLGRNGEPYGHTRSNGELQGQHQDAHEFFIDLLEALEPHTGSGPIGSLRWPWTSVVVKQQICTACRKQTDQKQPYGIFDVETTHSDVATALRNHLNIDEPENVDLKCCNGDANVPHEQSFLRFDGTAPSVLGVHMKIFKHHGDGGQGSKFDGTLSVPEDISVDGTSWKLSSVVFYSTGWI